jgi:hypothetical protein
MAKRKKRAVARRKSAKRAKASVKPASKKTATKKAAKHATAKPKAKSRVRRTTKAATKPAAGKVKPQQAPVAEKPVEIEKLVETTIIATVETPTPTVVEEALEVANSAPADNEREETTRPAEGIDVSSGVGELSERKVA